MLNNEVMGSVIKNVVRAHHWTMDYIEGLYLDDADPYGLIYWHYDVKQCAIELRETSGNTPQK